VREFERGIRGVILEFGWSWIKNVEYGVLFPEELKSKIRRGSIWEEK
jgi:hypothetical protein